MLEFIQLLPQMEKRNVKKSVAFFHKKKEFHANLFQSLESKSLMSINRITPEKMIENFALFSFNLVNKNVKSKHLIVQMIFIDTNINHYYCYYLTKYSASIL